MESNIPELLAEKLDSMSPEMLQSILDKIRQNKKPIIAKPVKKNLGEIRIITHVYSCEFCYGVKKKEFPVRVVSCSANKDKEVVLYHVCTPCRELVVKGLAFALMMKKATV